MKGKQEGKIKRKTRNSIIYSIPSVSVLYFLKQQQQQQQKYPTEDHIKHKIFFVEGTSKCLYLYFMIR